MVLTTRRIFWAATGAAAIAWMGLLTGCHAAVPDDHSHWYGPVVRKMNSLPPGLHDFLFDRRGSACLADPGGEWGSSDVTSGFKPTGQLIWARRMGPHYVVYRIEGGSNIATHVDVVDATTSKNVWETDDYLFATGRMPRPPAGLDSRIVRVVGYIYSKSRSCSESEAPEGSLRGECRRWPLR
jgi:hypothetical protein